jgi:hypothetical protein
MAMLHEQGKITDAQFEDFNGSVDYHSLPEHSPTGKHNNPLKGTRRPRRP